MDIYKLGEGKIARRIAFYSGLLVLVWGFKSFATWLQKFDFAETTLLGGFQTPYYALPFSVGVLLAIVLTAICGFVLFKMLNKPTPSDLLIDTETEMKKVHWPSWPEARQATVIVLLFVAFCAAYLTLIEFVLKKAFEVILSIGA